MHMLVFQPSCFLYFFQRHQASVKFYHWKQTSNVHANTQEEVYIHDNLQRHQT